MLGLARKALGAPASDEATIATVDQNGLVTPVAFGQTNIRATAGTASGAAALCVAGGHTTAILLPLGSRDAGVVTIDARPSHGECNQPGDTLSYVWDCVTSGDQAKCDAFLAEANVSKIVS